MSTPTYTMGQKILVKRVFKRHKAGPLDVKYSKILGRVITYRSRREWRGELVPPEPRWGIVVGLRTLRNGSVDEDREFIADGKVAAILVVFSMYENPVYAPVNQK